MKHLQLSYRLMILIIGGIFLFYGTVSVFTDESALLRSTESTESKQNVEITSAMLVPLSAA